MFRFVIAVLLMCIAGPSFAQQGTEAEQLADLHAACASLEARTDFSRFDSNWDSNYLTYRRSTLELESRPNLNNPDSALTMCFARRRLAQLDGAPLLKIGGPQRLTPRAAPTPQPSVAIKAAALPEKLPKARPVKQQRWSPQAMSVNKTQNLDPKYAAERADILASCAPAIHQLGAFYPAMANGAVNLSVEGRQLSDESMSATADILKGQIAILEGKIANDNLIAARLAGARVSLCTFARRLAQLDGSPLISGAVDGTLTPLSIGGSAPPWKQQGKDAHIIASDGKSAMDCVTLETEANSDSAVSGGRRLLVNRCSDEVEIGWCYTPGDCETETGSGWTVQPGRSWPVSAKGEVRWAACHGANTTSFVKGTYGLRYYCKAPATKH